VAGLDHQCVLGDDGTVRCRGDNERGQCGPQRGPRESRTPVQLRLR
jgi:hypothetical protein